MVEVFADHARVPRWLARLTDRRPIKVAGKNGFRKAISTVVRSVVIAVLAVGIVFCMVAAQVDASALCPIPSLIGP
jgi:hypothetical protein